MDGFFTPDLEFNTLVFGEQHPATIQYLEDYLHRPTPALSQAAQQFFTDRQLLFDQFNSAEALRMAHAALRKSQGINDPNAIHSFFDLVDIQHAGPVMQRWIMAMPEVRQLYFQQRLDGFADSYVDLHPGQVGEDHYDWRRIHDGLVIDTPENPEYDWQHTEYLGDEIEGDRQLTLEEKIQVLSTWDFVKAHLDAGKDDPTSPLGGKL